MDTDVPYVPCRRIDMDGVFNVALDMLKWWFRERCFIEGGQFRFNDS